MTAAGVWRKEDWCRLVAKVPNHGEVSGFLESVRFGLPTFGLLRLLKLDPALASFCEFALCEHGEKHQMQSRSCLVLEDVYTIGEFAFQGFIQP